nr:hypothetical protein [Tanacetum cinerariifolium]
MVAATMPRTTIHRLHPTTVIAPSPPPPSPHRQRHKSTTTAGTTATAVGFPAAAAAVVGLWVADWPLPPRVDWVMVMSNSGCTPPNHHCGGGRMTVQPPQPHLVVSGCDGATTSKASGRSATTVVAAEPTLTTTAAPWWCRACGGLHKGYDRFQTLLSQLEIHGAGVSYEDGNQKFLRSLPFSWSQMALIMRTKPGLDTLSFDDLYNNLRVFERDVKGTIASSPSSNIQNVSFVSANNISSTNDVSTVYSVSSPSVSKSQKEGFVSYTDEVIHSFFANQSSAPQLDYDDLEQINDDDLEKIDLKWQVGMISMRIKKFHKRTGKKLQFHTKDPVELKGINGNKARDAGRRPSYQDDSKALVTIDGEDIDWFGYVEEDTQNYAMMACSSSNSGSNNEEKSCSKTCA